MATWQLRAWLIPERVTISSGPDLAEAIREGATEAWAGLTPGWCEAAVERLGLPPGRSCDRDIAMWGTEDGHYVQELSSGAQLLEAEIAIDARVVDVEYCRRVAHSQPTTSSEASSK